MKETIFSLLTICMPLFVVGQEQRLEISSTYLDTKTELKIFDLGEKKSGKPVVYFTDGAKLLQAGFLDRITTLFNQEKIPPAYLVFVSAVDLNDQVDKRNTYFFCNSNYLDFFEKEVLPRSEKAIGSSFSPMHRALVGISFGGLNAAWFSAKSSAFTNYALLSPVTYPCKKVITDIAFSSNEKLRVYISTGKNDAEHYTEPLHKIYGTKRYKLHFEQTNGGHDFDNWLNQIETVFTFLFSDS